MRRSALIRSNLRRSGAGGGGGTGDDIKVKVTAADTTTDFLSPKLVAGTNITLTVQNPGANENIKIDAAATDDKKVKVSADDTTPGFLEDKLIGGTNVTLTTVNPGGDEDVKIDVTAVAATAKHVWDYFADQGLIDSDGSDWPTSLVAPAGPDAIKNFMHTRELVDDAVTGFAMQFDIPTGATEVKIRIWSRGTGTAGPWVPLLRATNLPDAAAIPAFAALELMTAISEAATTNGNYTEEIKTFAAIGNLTAGERGVLQMTRDKVGQGGDTLATSVFIYHIQLIFQQGGG